MLFDLESVVMIGLFAHSLQACYIKFPCTLLCYNSRLVSSFVVIYLKCFMFQESLCSQGIE